MNDVDRSACLALRMAVFVDEQAVPAALEADEHDRQALHMLARRDGIAVATARAVLRDCGQVAKIGRVAVRRDLRGRGIGAAIMRSIELEPALQAVDCLVLEAQIHAVGFYERLGYVASGAVFMDAGIPHRFMHKVRR